MSQKIHEHGKIYCSKDGEKRLPIGRTLKPEAQAKEVCAFTFACASGLSISD